MSESTLFSAEDPVFTMHRGGKISVRPSVDVADRHGLAMAYTPGVARVCTAIADQPELAADYTWVSNTVAVVTDGTAVLGLGDIGPAAATSRTRSTTRWPSPACSAALWTSGPATSPSA